jgi:hypothetical protein
MTDFDDFRVSLTPDLQTRGTWKVHLDECPLEALAGLKGGVQPGVTREQLMQLRSRYGWPDSAKLRMIGQSVWQSLMTPGLKEAFVACFEYSQNANRRMRLVVSMVGDEPEPAGPGQISFHELPLEALYFDQMGFLAPNLVTPVSRSLNYKSYREPHRVALPLRILVVVATPEDKPPANMQDEKDAIQEALEELTARGAVELKFCEPPTKAQLREWLRQKRFHVLHFIGHGGFDIVGDDPSPRPHLCLEHANGQSDPLDAETLEMPLLNSDVRLVVLTVCSSAAPTPDEEPYHARAFDGVAQRLVSGVSGVSAVVAMQFDLESEAAVTFSSTFYDNLLKPDRPLDEIVALCRQDLAVQMNAGHRAWVTPVTYWRSKGGKVFELDGTKVAHDEQTQKKLTEIDTILGAFLENLTEVKSLPPEEQDAAAPWVARLQQKVDELQQQRGQLLGETLRLRGGPVTAGGTIQCRLTLQLRTPAQIGTVSVRVRYPSDKVEFGGASTGANIPPGNDLLVGENQSAGILTLLLQDASHGGEWGPDEFELGMLNLRVQTGVTDPFLQLSVIDAKVQRDGVDTPFEAVDAVLYLA